MKKILLFLAIIFVSPSAVLSQNSLPESRRSSAGLFVYKLNEKDVRNLYLKERELDESMLHTFVLSCAERKDIPLLPRGNYISVRVVGNKLEYSDHTVDNLYCNVVEDEKVMLLLCDTLGNVIDDAVVKRGLKRLRFDEATQTYNTTRIGEEKVVEVNNEGVLHYIGFEKEYNYGRHFFRSSWWNIKNAFNRVFGRNRAPVRNKYNGFVVFSKPKYKPGETVRFKACIDSNGRPYDEEAEVAVVSYYPDRLDTVLTALRPYRPGMFEWEFTLSDSLKLRLDSSYDVVFRTKGERTNDIKGRFYYEEYELGRITFEAEADKKKYTKGEAIKLQFNARDENNMPVYDGRVEVVVKPSEYRERKYFSDSIFIPDETWRHSLDMTGKASAEILLPDSVFVKNAAIHYDIECSFFDSGNEKQVRDLSVYVDTRDRLIDFSVEKGVLTVREMAEGESVSARALLAAYNTEAETVWQDSVMLPYSMPLLWIAADYSAKTKMASGDFCVEDMEDDIIGYRFFRDNGKVRLVVDNPAGFPFWYTVKKGGAIINKGYTTELDYTRTDRGKNGYTVQLSYLLGEEARTIQGSLPYAEKNISMEVNTPSTVYPGQTAVVEVAVRDKNGRPVRNADVTAYAFTSKFGPHSPAVTVFGKSRSGKPFVNKRYETYEEGPYNTKSPMEWGIWRQRMGLDSIEYYKFLYPETCYSYSGKAVGEVTQISPYMVIDGNVQGVHILWIDEQPHYFHQAQQLNVYSFPVTPGYHTLKFRTYDREVVAENIYMEEGKKTIVSVNGKQSAVDANSVKDERPLLVTVTTYEKENRGVLSEREIGLLKDYMITVENTFGTAVYPNDNQPVDIPAMINAGGVYYYLNNKINRRYDYGSRSHITEPVLVGPFPYRGFSTGGKNIGTLYADTAFVSNFEIEGGYRYTIWNNYLKQQSWGQLPFSRTIKPFSHNLSFDQNALTSESIRADFYRRLLERAGQRVGLMVPATRRDADGCRLKLEVGYFADKNTRANPLMIRLSGLGAIDSVEYFYYGATRDFDKLPEGKYRIDLIFRDSTRYSCYADLQRDGLNYLKQDMIVPEIVDDISRKAFETLYSQVRISHPSNPWLDYRLYAVQDSVITISAQNIGGFNPVNYTGKIITGTVRDKKGEPLAGVAVVIEGTSTGVSTESDGKFTLPDTGSGNLLISYLGFKPLTTRLISGYDYKITLEEDYNAIDDVVVVGYGSTRKRSLTGSVSVAEEDISFEMLSSEALEGKLAGVRIRGTSSIADGAQPLIIVNGVPYDGALSDLEPGEILSLNVLKDASSAIYGSRAAHGVIFIETKDGGPRAMSGDESIFSNEWNSANTLRTNFHDDAFWYPALSTGRDGTVTFEVTYPDDITNWNANFIAIGGRKQTDKEQLSIRSFKPLNAQLSMPQFAIRGDSLSVIGRLTNHLGDTVRIKRSIETGGYNSEENISLAVSHTDNIPVVVNMPDSVGVTYSLAMDNGYFDGERRTIPVYKQGVSESYGEFAVLSDTVSRRFATDSALGPATVHAEASAMNTFLEEIDRVDRYPYLCNEQMASKIKALLLKRRIYEILDLNFTEDRKIGGLIRKLERNRNSDNLWGWWNQDKTELWISKQIVEAMLDVEAAGYEVDFSKQTAADALIRELNRRLSSAGGTDLRFVKHDLLNLLGLLKKLDAKIDYTQYFMFVSSLPDATLGDRLKSMEMASVLDTGEKPQIDTLLSLAAETTMGSMCWAEKEKGEIGTRHILLPHRNSVENTLTAYRILRGAAGHEEELRKIRNYFFEMRKGGSWQNTYESSRILETIIPDMIGLDNNFKDIMLAINGKRFETFPITEEFAPGEVVEVKNEGTLPVFFTVYQQCWNENPEGISEGFSVKTDFYDEDGIITVLEAGKSVDLRVSVSADSDAEYVMIEVPIPAGCSYESKSQGNPWQETHREYHKEKVAVFCNKLLRGEHEFTIKLIPRYTGLYHINPAKIELMYYPTFFGRENMKICEIYPDQ